MLTGLKCPGCGSQRAVHHLLNFEIDKAFQQNQLLIISIPYILLGFVIDFTKNPSTLLIKIRKVLFGYHAILIVLFIVITFWITRNLPYFTN